MYEIILNKNDVPIYGSITNEFAPTTYDLPYGDYVILDYQDGSKGVPEYDLISHTISGLELLKEFKCVNIVLSYHAEALHSNHWISIINKVKEYGYEKVVVLDGGLNLTIKVPGIKLHHVMSDCLINIYDEPTIVFPRTKLYSCLARKLRNNRLLMISELYRRKLNYSGNITCGWSEEDQHLYDNPNIIKYIPDNLKLLLPIEIGTPDNHLGMVKLEPEMYRTVFNLVLESNAAPELYSQTPLIETTSDRHFLTEKTIKAFVLGQIPIILSLPGFVNELRTLGFDMFDDVVNHDYDDIIDIQARVEAIANRISKVARITIPAWNSYLIKNMPRLIKNYQLTQTLALKCRSNLIDSVNHFK